VWLLYDSWEEFDRVTSGLTDVQATVQHDGGSSFAWTAAHLANQVDAWINVRFQEREPHSLVGQDRFRVGGAGTQDDWAAVQRSVEEVQAAARGYLDAMTDDDLRLVIPYDGSIKPLHESGLELRYAVVRAIAHYFFHTGEIAAKRVRLGHEVGDYPGPLRASR
jgi:hypothetical protein